MEPDEFYKVIIHSHDNNEDIELLLRRQKGNDASGLTTHENDLKCNNGYTLSFETEQFFAGSKAKSLMTTYFSSNGDQDVVICIGSIVLNQQDMN
ncbi:hypothetical protein RMCBS344292_09829 [Rhizopus microsporus]|nr:hypothetical protein RMCBS344292_09829 [Rhizopus microsporus]